MSLQNNELVHALSSTARGAYTILDTALPCGHHNPAIMQHIDGTYLLFTNTLSKTASNTLLGPTPCPKLPPDGLFASYIALHYSTSLHGPWQRAGQIMAGSNPVPHVLANGSVVVAYDSGLLLQVSLANHWRGPYQPQGVVSSWPRTSNVKAEAQHLWYDPKAQQWRIAFHRFDQLQHAYLPRTGLAHSAGPDLLSEWSYCAVDSPMYSTAVRPDHGAESLSLSVRLGLSVSRT